MLLRPVWIKPVEIFRARGAATAEWDFRVKRYTQTDIHTDRQTQAYRLKDRHVSNLVFYAHSDRYTDKGTRTCYRTDRPDGKHVHCCGNGSEGQPYRQVRQTSRQTRRVDRPDRRVDRPDRQTGRQTRGTDQTDG